MVYSAEMIEIISAFSSTKSKISLGLTIYYGTYSIGQIILAPFIKKVNMKWFITVTVLLSGISFSLIGIADSLWQLYVIFGLNGFLQTGIWGGVMFFVGKYIPHELLGFSSKFLGTAMGCGTALTYGASAFFVVVASWKMTFVFFAALTVLSVFIFAISLRNAQKHLSSVSKIASVEHIIEKEEERDSYDAETTFENRSSLLFRIIFLCALTFLFCCIYYAFNSWFPSLLSEKFSMPSEYAIFFTILLPLSQIFCPAITVSLCEKTKSVDKISFVFSLISALLLGVLCFTFSKNMIIVIIVSVIMLFLVRGIINLLSAYVPLQLKNYVDPGTFSLIINATATVSAAIIPPLAASVIESDSNGWLYFFIMLTALALLSALMFGYSIIKNRFKSSGKNRTNQENPL